MISITTPTTTEEVQKLAELYFTASHVKSKHKTVGNIAYVILYCLEHDINVTEGLQFIYLIGDKLAAQAELMLSMVYRSGKLKSFDEKINGSFKDGSANAVCTIHREGFEKKSFIFSIDDAKRARLWDRNPIWKGYPQRMLTMKARTYALKDTCADIIGGLISEDEARDIVYHKGEGLQRDNQIKLKPKVLGKPKELQVLALTEPKIGAPAKLINEPKHACSKLFDEEYLVDEEGSFHFSSGVTYKKGILKRMSSMSEKAIKEFHIEQREAAKGKHNLYENLLGLSPKNEGE